MNSTFIVGVWILHLFYECEFYIYCMSVNSTPYFSFFILYKFLCVFVKWRVVAFADCLFFFAPASECFFPLDWKQAISILRL